MSHSKILKSIFSINNDGKYKIVKLFGIKIAKIERAKKFTKYYKDPIEKNKIVLINFNGNGYGCNPKYIAEELLKHHPNSFKLVWLARKKVLNTSHFPPEIKVVNYNSQQALKELITANFIISNVRLCSLIEKGWNKRAGQIYIQTWHGSLGIKKIDADVKGEAFTKRSWCTTAHTDSKYTDYLLSNSQFENEVFEHGFWYDGKIKQIGHPRNDIFFIPDEVKKAITEKVHSKLNISFDKKILLYAPSFRDEERLDCFNIDSQNILNILKSKFGSEWVLAIRMHPRLAKESKNIFKFSKEIIDASEYPDIQELLMASEAMITDYSSCIFDFMLSRKPAFIFATDIEKYNTERGLYYPLESTPFPIATNNNELIENIKNFDYEKYKNEVELFLQEKGCIEDGHASERIVNIIEQIVGQK